MESIDEMKVDFNSRVRINLGGGDLSSDSGELLLAEFMESLGVRELIVSNFKTKRWMKSLRRF